MGAQGRLSQLGEGQLAGLSLGAVAWSDLFALTIEHCPAAIAVFDREMRYLVSSGRWLAYLGVADPAHVVGRYHYDVFPDFPRHWRDAHQRCLTGAVERCDEERFSRGDAHEDWLRWEMRPWHAASGEVGGSVVFVETITRQKVAEEELQTSSQRLRLALDGAKLGTWHWQLKTDELVWSDLCFTMCGLKPGEPMTYERFLSLLHPDDRARVQAAVRRALEEKRDYDTEYRSIWPDGSIHWMSAKGRAFYDADGHPLSMEGVVVDITPRKEAERALSESRERFRNLAEGMPHMLWQLDANGTLIYANRGWCRYFGRDSIALFQWSEVVHPDDLERVVNAFPAMTQGETNLEPFRLRSHDGTYRWFTCRSVPARDEFGQLQHITGISTDVDELKRVEEALRVSQARLGTALQAAGMGTWVWEIEGDHMLWDESMTQLFGLDPAQPEPRTMQNLLSLAHPEDRPGIERAVRRALRHEGDFEAEYRALCPNGRTLWLSAKGRMEDDTLGRPHRLFGACVDVTQHKQLEAELRQAQKMEAIGQLAGGVAHDFNNLLTVILGQASIAELAPALPKQARDSIRDISEAAERAASLTAQLLAFGRRQVMNARNIALDDVVEGVASMLKRMLGEQVSLVVEPSHEPSRVHADPTMMTQVLLNLAINARDAMPGGGRLSIRTYTEQVDERTVTQVPGSTVGRFVCLSVSDTGPGIASEVLPHIFEPFFTTKEVGKGTGLGLATVYGIVKQHHGWVSVSSEAGAGATFRVFLPRATEETRSGEEDHVTAEFNVEGRGEWILVVEDEAGVRTVLQSVLERHGYRLLVAQNSGEALDAWHRHGPEVSLLLTDVVMPGSLSGCELAAQLQARKPNLKTILCSGYSTANIAREAASLRSTVFLQKPYRTQQLLALVRRVLDE
ncbi:MAG: PAS domain-containing protein [Myxococcales bacterium]